MAHLITYHVRALSKKCYEKKTVNPRYVLGFLSINLKVSMLNKVYQEVLWTLIYILVSTEPKT